MAPAAGHSEQRHWRSYLRPIGLSSRLPFRRGQARLHVASCHGGPWTFICRAIRFFHTCRYDPIFPLLCSELLNTYSPPSPPRPRLLNLFCLPLYLINTLRTCAIVIISALGAIRRARINAVRLLLVVVGGFGSRHSIERSLVVSLHSGAVSQLLS